MGRMLIQCGDRRYHRTLELELTRYTSEIYDLDQTRPMTGDTVLCDADSSDAASVLALCADAECFALVISRHADKLNALAAYPGVALLHKPFRDGKLAAVCGLEEGAGRGEDAPEIYLSPDGRYAYCGGREIKLTEAEGRLLRALLDARGAYVSRSELHRLVFGGEGNASVVGTYIHYLRNKLEQNGRRLIYSHRGGGYRIGEGD